MSSEAVSDVLHHVLDNAHRDSRHIAVKDAESALTYGQLTELSGKVAAALAIQGVGEGDRVVLLLQNSIDFVIGALASLWIGAIFVPLDATDPLPRLVSLMRDCQPAIVLFNELVDVTPLLDILEDSVFVKLSPLLTDTASAPTPVATRERPSYIIYTSGTTGASKGVTVGSSAFEAAILSSSAALNLDSSTRTLSVSPFHFDGSFGTLFTTLVSGGTLIIRPRESLLFPRVFFNTLVSESVTYTGFSPSYLRSLESDPLFEQLASCDLRVIALGGEASTVGDIERLWSVAPQLRIFNRYGPTETVVAVTHVELTPAIVSRGVVPLGVPHPGVEFYLIDEYGRLIEKAGTEGELFIGGRQLMDGYWNSPELSAMVLRTDIVSGRRTYRTGDIVYVDTHGNYVYVDRADRVVKRRGVRISLLEITDAFRTLNDVRTAACIVFDNGNTLGIAVFLVMDSNVSRADLHKQSREMLPSSMIPDHLEIVTSIPVTASGKTDERRLLAEAGLNQYRQSQSP